MPDTSHHRPISGMDLPRYAGIASFMRLPLVAPADAGTLDVAIMGLPWDGGTTTRNGSRYGPRQIREMSTLLRAINGRTRVDPFEIANIADVGDAPSNPVDPARSLAMLEEFVRGVADRGARPLCLGGDHLVSLPVLRALKPKRPLGMIHFDAHTDLYDVYYGDCRYTHGTPFRRAIEEGLLDPQRVVQIGIRGTLFAHDDYDWAFQQGVLHVTVDALRDQPIGRSIDAIRAKIGEAPCYVTLDVDALDPSCAPGTGVPEVGGLTSYEAQRILCGLRGLDVVGADVVEVSPPLDASGVTALVAANLAFDMLCLLAESAVKRKAG